MNEVSLIDGHIDEEKKKNNDFPETFATMKNALRVAHETAECLKDTITALINGQLTLQRSLEAKDKEIKEYKMRIRSLELKLEKANIKERTPEQDKKFFYDTH